MKDKIINFYNNNKFKIIVACIFVVVIFAIFIPVSLSVNSKEQKFNDELKKIASDFYENTYYNQIGNDDGTRLAFLTKYKSTGIKIDLENLSRTTNNANEVLKKFNGCNKENTKVIIYPVEPFNQKDYTVEIELDCGFSN